MPWKVSSEVDERLHFVASLLEGEAMTDLCVEFAISRQNFLRISVRMPKLSSSLPSRI
jgi:hypothetical protein